MCFGIRAKKRNRGVTFIEIILTLALLLIITAPMITTLKLSADKISAYMDYRKAFNRTSMAVALLKTPVFYCGLGMPVSADKYKNAFGNLRFEPFRWNGPIEVRTGPSSYPNSELRIAYAQPGSSRLAELSVNTSFSGSVMLNRFPESNELPDSFSGSSTDLRRWLLFCGIMPPSLPLYITGVSGKKLFVENNISSHFSIPKGERPCIFRAMTVYCRNGCVYTRDFRASGDQPRVKGIMDMRFDVDVDNKLITVYVLSRGDNIYDNRKLIIGQDSWPEEYISPWIKKSTGYQMYASKFVWRLPNCICESITDGKNVTEQFL